jgi:hypothetical protein
MRAENIQWGGMPVPELAAMMGAYLLRGEAPPLTHPLAAILANDWTWSMVLADEPLRQQMPRLAMWMHHNLPPHAWGSHQKVRDWIALAAQAA